jgi:hypothetical protein
MEQRALAVVIESAELVLVDFFASSDLIKGAHRSLQRSAVLQLAQYSSVLPLLQATIQH